MSNHTRSRESDTGLLERLGLRRIGSEQSADDTSGARHAFRTPEPPPAIPASFAPPLPFKASDATPVQPVRDAVAAYRNAASSTGETQRMEPIILGASNESSEPTPVRLSGTQIAAIREQADTEAPQEVTAAAGHALAIGEHVLGVLDRLFFWESRHPATFIVGTHEVRASVAVRDSEFALRLARDPYWWQPAVREVTRVKAGELTDAERADVERGVAEILAFAKRESLSAVA